MNSKIACSLALAAAASAQGPSFVVEPALVPGQPLLSVLAGLPGQPYATLLDATGGPSTLLGEPLLLGLTGVLAVLDAGALPASGTRVLLVPTPPGAPVGLPLYLQSLALDASAPNGVFRASDGESTVFFTAPRAIVDKLVDAAAQGYTGSFDRTVRGRMQGAPVRVRTVRIAPPGGVPFGQPILGPLDPYGVRQQVVLRAADLGLTGQPEQVTAIRWLPFPGVPVVDETFQRLVIELSHSNVVPDYTIDPMSALPKYPQSGLSLAFAANVKVGDSPVRVYDGGYAIRAANVRPDGYLDYPTFQAPFTHDGFDSLLIDFKMSPSPGTAGLNGGLVHLMVLSSALPYSRVRDSGSAQRPVDPHATTQATQGGNELPDLQVELASVLSDAVSPWRQAALQRPDYDPAYVAYSTPAGGGWSIEYQGTSDPSQGPSTPWVQVIDFADGYPFLRYRITFAGSPASRAVPSVDAVVIPYR